MTSRPLHAVLLPPSAGDRMLSALAAALDGSGPAIMPLDPELPRPALAGMLETLAPSALLTLAGTTPLPGTADRASTTSVADDTAVVIATSGSTGEPKGVELTAAALTASAAAALRRIGARPGDRWLCCLPTFHISGLGVLVRSVLSGTDPVFGASSDAAALAASGCAHVSLVPTQLRRLLDAGAGPDGIATVLLGGAPAPADLLSAARSVGWRIVTSYGMSETCGGCVYDGVPLDGVEVRTSEDGRIEIAGPVLFSGYRLRRDLTAAALRDGRFRTADLGYFAPDGRLVVRGRADDVIITGGEKVIPGEVEAVLGTCQKVTDVVVVGVPDGEWGEQLTALVVASDPADPPALDELRSIVREALSVHAAPRKMHIMSAFPQLPSGKPDRAMLRDLAERLSRTNQPNAGTETPRGNK